MGSHRFHSIKFGPLEFLSLKCLGKSKQGTMEKATGFISLIMTVTQFSSGIAYYCKTLGWWSFLVVLFPACLRFLVQFKKMIPRREPFRR